MKLNFNLLTIGLIFSFLSSCTSHKYQPKFPIVAEDSTDQLLEDFVNLYPPEFKMVHRVVFKFRKREFDFTGYFLMRRPDVFHAAAYAEAGSAIFEFQNIGEHVDIQAKPEIFSDDSISDGIAQDLLHIYRKPDKSEASLVHKTGDSRTFAMGHADTLVNEFHLIKSSGVTESLTAVNGEIIREVTYKNPKAFAKWAKPIPTEIKIKNYLFNYEIHISVVEFFPSLPNNFDQMLLAP